MKDGKVINSNYCLSLMLLGRKISSTEVKLLVEDCTVEELGCHTSIIVLFYSFPSMTVREKKKCYLFFFVVFIFKQLQITLFM